jgi:hypothetical protein
VVVAASFVIAVVLALPALPETVPVTFPVKLPVTGPIKLVAFKLGRFVVL